MDKSAEFVVIALTKAAPATSDEAIPPKPLKAATSSGMEVISTLMARKAPIAVPITSPIMII